MIVMAAVFVMFVESGVVLHIRPVYLLLSLSVGDASLGEQRSPRLLSPFSDEHGLRCSYNAATTKEYKKIYIFICVTALTPCEANVCTVPLSPMGRY